MQIIRIYDYIPVKVICQQFIKHSTIKPAVVKTLPKMLTSPNSLIILLTTVNPTAECTIVRPNDNTKLSNLLSIYVALF